MPHRSIAVSIGELVKLGSGGYQLGSRYPQDAMQALDTVQALNRVQALDTVQTLPERSMRLHLRNISKHTTAPTR